MYLQTTNWHYVVLTHKEEVQIEHDTVSFPLLSLTSQIASNDVKVVLVVYVSAARNVFEMSSERLEAVTKVTVDSLCLLSHQCQICPHTGGQEVACQLAYRPCKGPITAGEMPLSLPGRVLRPWTVAPDS